MDAPLQAAMTEDPIRAALEDAWDALGYCAEWAYAATGPDPVLDACRRVANDSFLKAAAALGWGTHWPSRIDPASDEW